MDKSPREVIEIVNSRLDVLELLADHSASKADATTELSISRSTVGRSIDQLEEVNLARRSEGGAYTTSPFGDLILRKHKDYLRLIERLVDDEDLIEFVDWSEIPEFFLRDLKVIPTHPGVLEATYRPILNMLKNATQLDMLMRQGTVFRLHLVFQCIDEGEIPIHIFSNENVWETLIEVDHDISERVHCDQSIELTVIDQTTPFGVWVIEAKTGAMVALEIYDGPHLLGILVNDNPCVIDWGRGLINDFEHSEVFVT